MPRNFASAVAPALDSGVFFAVMVAGIKTSGRKVRLVSSNRRRMIDGVGDGGEYLSPWLGKVHHGDCIRLMKKMPANSVGVVVTSPPYNIRNSTGNGLKCGRGGKWPNAALQKGYEEHDDDMPYAEYVAWQRECLSAMVRVLRKDGVIFYNHKWRVQNGLLQDRADIVSGFPVRQIIIWKRKGGINFNPGYFLPTYEVIYMIAGRDFRLAPRANAHGDVWTIPQERGNRHPAPFPVELARRCVSATPGGVVLDPFLGSGTTAIAAESCGREWIGMDISREYCALARARIRNSKKSLFHDSAAAKG